VDSAPIFNSGSVNIDHTCTRCGQVVMTTSWTREAWDEDHQAAARD